MAIKSIQNGVTSKETRKTFVILLVSLFFTFVLWFMSYDYLFFYVVLESPQDKRKAILTRVWTKNILVKVVSSEKIDNNSADYCSELIFTHERLFRKEIRSLIDARIKRFGYVSFDFIYYHEFLCDTFIEWIESEEMSEEIRSILENGSKKQKRLIFELMSYQVWFHRISNDQEKIDYYRFNYLFYLKKIKFKDPEARENLKDTIEFLSE